ncbi:hypothetical protein FF1_034541 [Malus domestica]
MSAMRSSYPTTRALSPSSSLPCEMSNLPSTLRLSMARDNGSLFTVNPYPFFAYQSDPRPETLAFCLFQPNAGRVDSGNGIKYMNLFDAQVDAVRSTLNAVGFKDIDILIAETGWPYHGDDNKIGPSVENARAYNGNLIAHLRSMVGTPLMPGKSVETYIFALYDEDLKPGLASERSFGLFKPDLTATYDVGITKSSQTPSTPTVSPSPKPTSAQWCVPKSDVFIAQLQANLDYAYGHGIDCSAIQLGGACFDPNTVASHAAYVMNLYYHIVVTVPLNCDFSQTATLTSSNPNKFSLTRAHIEMAQVYHDEDALYTKGYPGGSTGLHVEAGKVNIISNNGFVKVRNQLDIRNKVLVYFFVVFNLYM